MSLQDPVMLADKVITLFVVFSEYTDYFRIQSINSSTQGLPYQYQSLMHFSLDEYSKYYYKFTITPIPIPFSTGSLYPTNLDYLHIKLLYCEGISMCVLCMCA